MARPQVGDSSAIAPPAAGHDAATARAKLEASEEGQWRVRALQAEAKLQEAEARAVTDKAEAEAKLQEVEARAVAGEARVAAEEARAAAAEARIQELERELAAAVAAAQGLPRLASGDSLASRIAQRRQESARKRTAGTASAASAAAASSSNAVSHASTSPMDAVAE